MAKKRAPPRKTAPIVSQQLRALIFDLYAAYSKGQFDVVLKSFDDKAKLISYAPTDVFPYLGSKQGKAAIAKTMKTVHAEFEFLTYHPIFMVVEMGDAAAIVMARVRQRSTDRIIHFLVAHFMARLSAVFPLLVLEG